jgi:hypothetical protein
MKNGPVSAAIVLALVLSWYEPHMPRLQGCTCRFIWIWVLWGDFFARETGPIFRKHMRLNLRKQRRERGWREWLNVDVRVLGEASFLAR